MPEPTCKASSQWGPSPEVIALRIRAERTRVGLTEREAAWRLGVSRASWRQYEATANPQLKTLVGLVERLGFRLEAIIPEALGGRLLLSEVASSDAMRVRPRGRRAATRARPA